MKFIFIALIMTFNIQILLSEDVLIDINLDNNAGQSFDLNKVGISDSATNGVDLELGEDEFPCMGFPGTVFSGYFKIVDDCSNIDIRESYKDSTTFMHIYNLHTFWGAGDTLFISSGNIPDQIDSAVVYDDYDIDRRFGDLKVSPVTVTNDVFERFIIKVYYKVEPTDLVEEIASGDVVIYPNPSNNYININCQDHVFTRFKISDLTGTEILKNTIDGKIESINLNSIDSGIYILELSDINNNKIIKKLIKY